MNRHKILQKSTNFAEVNLYLTEIADNPFWHLNVTLNRNEQKHQVLVSIATGEFLLDHFFGDRNYYEVRHHFNNNCSRFTCALSSEAEEIMILPATDEDGRNGVVLIATSLVG